VRLVPLSVVEEEVDFLWHVWTAWCFLLAGGASLPFLLRVAIGGRVLHPQGRVAWLGIYKGESSLQAELLGGCVFFFGQTCLP
jgi:hypothetical protein